MIRGSRSFFKHTAIAFSYYNLDITFSLFLVKCISFDSNVRSQALIRKVNASRVCMFMCVCLCVCSCVVSSIYKNRKRMSKKEKKSTCHTSFTSFRKNSTRTHPSRRPKPAADMRLTTWHRHGAAHGFTHGGREREGGNVGCDGGIVQEEGTQAEP